MASPSIPPSPSPLSGVSLDVGFLGPFFIALVALVVALTCGWLVIRHRAPGLFIVALPSAGVAVWQGILAYQQLEAWAKPFGGVGALLLGGGLVVCWLMSNSDSPDSKGGGTREIHHYNQLTVRDSTNINVIQGSRGAYQSIRQQTARQSVITRQYLSDSRSFRLPAPAPTRRRPR